MELLFSSTGRVGRDAFLGCGAALLALAYAYAYEVVPRVNPGLAWIVYTLLLFPTACILSKRLHDRGRSGWWAALVLVSVVAIWPAPERPLDFLFSLVVLWAVVELGAMPGEQGANRFGPNPLKTVAAV